MKLGGKLKQLRVENGFTQQQVADKLQITRQAYSRYENDLREIPLDSLVTLADLYDESLDTICNRKKY